VVKSVCYSDCGNLLATCSWDSKINIYETQSYQLLQKLNAHEEEWVYKIRFSSDTKYLVSVGNDNSIVVHKR
jgi:WD40 repeat protein